MNNAITQADGGRWVTVAEIERRFTDNVFVQVTIRYEVISSVDHKLD